MTDIRDLVTEDRGIIKKIQAFLPGYKKYRNCEDLRSADNLLRLELAKRLRMAESNISEARNDMARKMEMDGITLMGELLNRSHTLTEKVKHAEQGYSPWISGDIRIEEDELRRLYDYDLAMFERAEKLIAATRSLKDTTGGNGGNVGEMIRTVKNEVAEFDSAFSERIATVMKVAQER